MKISNPRELVGKEVVDQNGKPVGWIDKTWSSWNQEYPGWFFGIKPNETHETPISVEPTSSFQSIATTYEK